MLKVQVKYFVEDLPKLKFAGGNKSDWVDLRVAEEITMKAGEFCIIPLGVAIKLPTGYEAHIVPRSSTFKRYGILQTNSMGVIDESYCGDNDQWRFPALATRDVIIHKGERICQFRLVEHQPSIQFETVKYLEGPDRGGFGSTGSV